MYHDGNRELQDQFGSRALADRLEEKLRRERFTDADAAFISAQSFFFLATADVEGRPDCSFKGGPPVQALTLGRATRLHHTSSSNPIAHSGWSADCRSNASRRAFLAT